MAQNSSGFSSLETVFTSLSVKFQYWYFEIPIFKFEKMFVPKNDNNRTVQVQREGWEAKLATPGWGFTEFRRIKRRAFRSHCRLPSHPLSFRNRNRRTWCDAEMECCLVITNFRMIHFIEARNSLILMKNSPELLPSGYLYIGIRNQKG